VPFKKYYLSSKQGHRDWWAFDTHGREEKDMHFNRKKRDHLENQSADGTVILK
jgi:hypothetical protein